jgi:hypothetical protein
MESKADPNQFRAPRRGFWATIMTWLTNSPRVAAARRAAMSRLPFLTLESDVADVVYLNWMVEVSKVQSLIPAGTELWQIGGRTPFTILTYRHGHFGPSIFGPLRSLFPSPLQSNWRLYLATAPERAPRVRTVFFLKNVMSSTLYSLGTRLFSDALQTHLADSFSLEMTGSSCRIEIQPGEGSAPKLKASLSPSPSRELPSTFREAFGSWEAAVEYLTLQDAAVTRVPGTQRLAFSEIDLPIDLSTLQPLNLEPQEFQCPFAELLGVESHALCFLLPGVRFRALSERLL